ncbi:MAG TPA: L-threonylcarbamoyladenylate synthase [Pyrinomonadaceae bacterium]|nr:L-threonylcarbamoyladenylate synthase [Pyrinomonadaceae bacterium]
MILPQNSENISLVVEIIARGGVIAFRTDTFYGLGADPFNASAVQKVKDLKGREGNKPILVLISDAEQLGRLIEERSATFDELAKQFWPGALTIIGKAARKLPSELTAGTNSVGVRLPDDEGVRSLVRACGGALTATSANLSGEPAARSLAEAAKYFGESVDLIVDGGTTKTDQPSSVVDAAGVEVKLVREGAIAWDKIQVALRGN